MLTLNKYMPAKSLSFRESNVKSILVQYHYLVEQNQVYSIDKLIHLSYILKNIFNVQTKLKINVCFPVQCHHWIPSCVLSNMNFE